LDRKRGYKLLFFRDFGIVFLTVNVVKVQNEKCWEQWLLGMLRRHKDKAKVNGIFSFQIYVDRYVGVENGRLLGFLKNLGASAAKNGYLDLNYNTLAVALCPSQVVPEQHFCCHVKFLCYENKYTLFPKLKISMPLPLSPNQSLDVVIVPSTEFLNSLCSFIKLQ
jgi:hypothetical protein